MKLQIIYKIGLAGLVITAGIMLVINIVADAQSLTELTPGLEGLANFAIVPFCALTLCGGYLWFYYIRRVKSTYNLLIFCIFLSSSFIGGLWAHYKFRSIVDGKENI